MSPCTHAFEDLTGGITGLACRKCRARFNGDHAHTVLLSAVQQSFQALNARLEAAERALLRLGLQPCERCGCWLHPDDPAIFHVEV